MSQETAPDPLVTLKEGVKWMWSQGDYPQLAVMLEPEAQALAARCALTPGTRVLDVAAGNGNFAIAALRQGAEVTAGDLTPRMVELGRERCAAEGLTCTWLEADAEALPFPDASFDVVASVFGAMFAPRPERVAAEMFRVARPGGIVAMANYGVEGFLGRLGGLIGRYSPSAPAMRLPSPFEWGDRDEVRRRFAGLASSIEIKNRTLSFRLASFAAWRELWEATNPPLMTLKKMLPGERYEALISETRALCDELNTASDGALLLESAYLSVVARR